MAFRTRNAFLSPEERALLRGRVFELLDRNGVRMDHPLVLERLAEAGARVDFGTKQVRFPGAFLETVIAQAPRAFRLAGRDPRHDLEVPRPDGTFHTRTATGAPFYLDPATEQRRPVTLADVADWARLADGLEAIDFCAFPSPGDVPPPTADIHALRCVLEHTGKHVWVQPYRAESIQYLLRLAAVAGGGEDALARRPIVSFITCSLTPLDFKFMDLEVMVQACPRGIPVHACSLPAAGTTAPITIPGTVLLAAAEILAMLAVAQTLRPGAPVVATPLIFCGDMATGASVQSSVEAIQGKAVAVELARSAFGIPTHTYGWGSDGPTVDGQSAVEGALLGALVASAGSDILGGAGQLEVAKTISPVQLVVDEEVARVLRRIVAGLALDDDTMAWPELLAAGPGAQFLTEMHTVRHCRDPYRSRLLSRDTRSQWETKGGLDLATRARERYRRIVAEPTALAVPEDEQREMDRVVRAADADLGR